MKRIILHGYLKDLYPHPIEVEASSVAEAVRSLENYPELHKADGSPHAVRIKGVDREAQLFAVSEIEEIHVVPETGGGGGRGGLLRILIGITVIALSFVPGAVGALSVLGATQGGMILFGASLLLGGVIELLMPKQKIDDGDQAGSATLGGAVNTTRIGTPIAIGYGNYKIGGQYLSFDVDAKDFSGKNDVPDPLFSDTDSAFYEHDKIVTPLVPILPVFSSNVASPTNIPVSGWT